MQRLLGDIFSIIMSLNPFFVIISIVVIGLMLHNSYKFLKYGGRFLELITKLIKILFLSIINGVAIVFLSIGEICSFRNIHFACSLDVYLNKHNIYKVLLYTLISGINLVSKLVFLLLSPLRFAIKSRYQSERINNNVTYYNVFSFDNPSLVLLN
jgi:hypothetical protein